MTIQTIDLSCRNCGAPAAVGDTKCRFCKQPVVITTFNSVKDMPMPMINQYAASMREALQTDPYAKDLNFSAATCYLKLKLYDKALGAFEKTMEDNFDNSETFFYAAICLLKGKKAFTAQRSDINKIEEYINAALAIEPKGIYYYFLSYIKYDYYERKFLNTSPGYRAVLANANAAGLSPTDIGELFGILGVPRPETL
jgi:tetratricopeptide (TPR) repeat protein